MMIFHSKQIDKLKMGQAQLHFYFSFGWTISLSSFSISEVKRISNPSSHLNFRIRNSDLRTEIYLAWKLSESGIVVVFYKSSIQNRKYSMTR